MSYRYGRKLTEEQVKDIRERRHAGESCASIAADYGIAACTVSPVALGRSYKHLNKKYPPVRSTFLQENEVRDIRVLARNGLDIDTIAATLDIPDYVVRNAAYGNTYKRLNKKYKPANPFQFSDEDVRDIRERRHAGESCASIADDYDTGTYIIWKTGAGMSYSRLNDKYPPVKVKKRKTKVTKDNKKAIRRLWSMPSRSMTLTAVAEKFGVSVPYIYRISVGQR